MRALHHRPLLSPLSSSIRRFSMTQPRMASSIHSRDPSPSLSNDTELPSKRRRISTPTRDTKMFPLSITLSPQEQTVRKLLVDVSAEIDKDTPEKEPIVLRFTGGWVRDKLLGIPSHDIDVGINRMTGYDFGNYLAGFLERNLDRYNIPPRTVHKIESNPEKSKHLETATTKILGLDIDLVNLRSEVYKADSRIPEMEFGTPVQDALRRDCTVNALFYNLHSEQVEDFTERGLEDMKNKVIRTPLPPYETFNDDPLRVLRLIRFSSRLGFEIVPEAKEAMQNPGIKTALRLKISRERIGTETEKMLKGQNPSVALTQIYDLSLYDCIFAPPIEALPSIQTQNLPLAISALSLILSAFSKYSHISYLFSTRNETYIAWVIAALTPWEGYTFPETNPKKIVPGAATAAREGLKATNRVFDTIARSYNNVDVVREVVLAANGGEWPRTSAAIFVRRLGSDWRSQVLCALLLDLVKAWKEGSATSLLEGRTILEKYNSLISKIYVLGVAEAYNATPILSGKDLYVLFNLKPGPWVKGVLDQVLHWQWQNPQMDKQAAIEWVTESKEKLLPAGGVEEKEDKKKRKV